MESRWLIKCQTSQASKRCSKLWSSLHCYKSAEWDIVPCCRCDTHASHEREQHRNLTKILDRVGMQAYHIRSSVAVENKCDIEVENETLTTRKDMSATMERGKENEWTYESKSSTLGLLLSTKLETKRTISMRRTKENGSTHCLQRFRVSCILYLHTLHSSLNTTFFVVFAYFHQRTQSVSNDNRNYARHTLSCGRRAWSDHHTLIACGRNGAFLARRGNLCPSCIASPYAVYKNAIVSDPPITIY